MSQRKRKGGRKRLRPDPSEPSDAAVTTASNNAANEPDQQSSTTTKISASAAGAAATTAPDADSSTGDNGDMPGHAVSPAPKRQRLMKLFDTAGKQPQLDANGRATNLTFEERRKLLLKGKIVQKMHSKHSKTMRTSAFIAPTAPSLLDAEDFALFNKCIGSTLSPFFIENNCIVGLDHQYGLSSIMAQLNDQSEYYAKDDNLLASEPCYVILYNIHPVVEHCDLIAWVAQQTSLQKNENDDLSDLKDLDALNAALATHASKKEFAKLIRKRLTIDEKIKKLYRSKMRSVRGKLASKQKKKKSQRTSLLLVGIGNDAKEANAAKLRVAEAKIKEKLARQKRREYLQKLPKEYFDVIKSGDLSQMSSLSNLQRDGMDLDETNKNMENEQADVEMGQNDEPKQNLDETGEDGEDIEMTSKDAAKAVILDELDLERMSSREREILRMREKRGDLEGMEKRTFVQGSVYPTQLTYFSSLTGRAWMRFNSKYEALHCVLRCNGFQLEGRVVAAGLCSYKRKFVDPEQAFYDFKEARVLQMPRGRIRQKAEQRAIAARAGHAAAGGKAGKVGKDGKNRKHGKQGKESLKLKQERKAQILNAKVEERKQRERKLEKKLDKMESRKGRNNSSNSSRGKAKSVTRGNDKMKRKKKNKRVDTVFGSARKALEKGKNSKVKQTGFNVKTFGNDKVTQRKGDAEVRKQQKMKTKQQRRQKKINRALVKQK